MKKRPIEALVSRVDPIECGPIARGRGKSRTTISETIKKDIDFNGLIIYMIYNKTL